MLRFFHIAGFMAATESARLIEGARGERAMLGPDDRSNFQPSLRDFSAAVSAAAVRLRAPDF
jgi:hypothetical protein